MADEPKLLRRNKLGHLYNPDRTKWKQSMHDRRERLETERMRCLAPLIFICDSWCLSTHPPLRKRYER